MQFLVNVMAGSDFTPFAAIFCVLPFSESFCEDLNSGFYIEIINRIGTRRYAFNRCISVAVSGGLTTALTILIAILACVVGGTLPDTENTVMPLMNSVWAKMGIVLTANGALMYALKVFTAFLFGMLWALVGLTISVLIPNRYVTLVAPFVIYQGLWYLLDERAINPVYMLRGDSDFIPSFAFLVIYQLICIMVCALISANGIIRRTHG